MKKITDNQKLIKLCAKNNRKAQEQLYHDYFDAMFSIGRRYTKDEDKITEWVNNGFLKVFKKIETVKNPNALPGWIKSVVFRCILDGIRAEKRYISAMFFDLDHEFKFKENNSSSHDLQVIMDHIELLPEASKKVFKLFVLEGFSHFEIADKVGISQGTSKWHLNNAKTKLRQILIDRKIIAV